MYYATYGKYTAALEAGQLRRAENNMDPAAYAQPDSGVRFRFPFPDEDKYPLGDIGEFDYDRGLPVKVSAATYEYLKAYPADEHGMVELHIREQKLLHREQDNQLILVALVLAEPSTRSLFRIEDEKVIGQICAEIIRNHVTGEQDRSKKQFYRQVAARIMKGYRLEEQQQQKNNIKTKNSRGCRPG